MKYLIVFIIFPILINAHTLLIPFTSTPSETQISMAFKEFMNKFKRNYESISEKEWRYNIFRGIYKYIGRENEQSNGITTLELNQFSDYTENEFESYYLNMGIDPDIEIPHNIEKKRNIRRENNNKITKSKSKFNTSPEEIDWVKRGHVTPVHKQGHCTGGWAFTLADSASSLHSMDHGQLLNLSSQQLIDCASEDGCKEPPTISQAYQYLIDYGLMMEGDYPYIGVRGSRCLYDADKVTKGLVKQVELLASGANQDTIHALEAAPLAVSIDAKSYAFRFYKQGTYIYIYIYILGTIISRDCTSHTNHEVLLVGCGSHPTVDFWYLKNSWGTTWGVDGFAYIERGFQEGDVGPCGVTKSVFVPMN